MAQVSVRVNGYSYMLSCGDGQEDHLRALAADIDRRIDGIKVAAGPSGESRLLLMAALVLSDELYEMRALMSQADAGSSPVKLPDAVARPEPKTARRLTRLARRAEAIAETAEQAEAGDVIARERASRAGDGVPEDMLPEQRSEEGTLPEDHPSGQNESMDGTRPDNTNGENIAARSEHP